MMMTQSEYQTLLSSYQAIDSTENYPSQPQLPQYYHTIIKVLLIDNIKPIITIVGEKLFESLVIVITNLCSSSDLLLKRQEYQSLDDPVIVWRRKIQDCENRFVLNSLLTMRRIFIVCKANMRRNVKFALVLAIVWIFFIFYYIQSDEKVCKSHKLIK